MDQLKTDQRAGSNNKKTLIGPSRPAGGFVDQSQYPPPQPACTHTTLLSPLTTPTGLKTLRIILNICFASALLIGLGLNGSGCDDSSGISANSNNNNGGDNGNNNDSNDGGDNNGGSGNPPPALSLATTNNAVSAHYVMFFYQNQNPGSHNFDFVVLATGANPPTSAADIATYDGSIRLKVGSTERAGLIFLPGTPSKDSDGVPTATLSASTSYKLYAAATSGGGAVTSINVETGARGKESPFRVNRNGSLVTKVYVGKKYGIVPVSDWTSTTTPLELIHTLSNGTISQIFFNAVIVSSYNSIMNIVDMDANNSSGVFLFSNTDTRDLGRNSRFRVNENNGGGPGAIELRFTDDASDDNERYISSSNFATTPAVQ